MAIALIVGAFSQVSAQVTGAQNGSAPAVAFTGDDALNPIAGKPYDYVVTTTAAAGSPVKWWATQETSFLNTDGTVNLTNVLYQNADTETYDGSTDPSFSVTWTTAQLAATEYDVTPTFVATMITDCSNNLKVYQINPVNGFTVDIKPAPSDFAASTYTDALTQCFASVASVKWTTTGMEYDYGKNTLYYEVVAANFTSEWTPTFQIDGLQTGQSAELKWSYVTNIDGNTEETIALAEGTSKVATKAVAVDATTSTTNGVSIYVAVTVSHTTYEGLGDTPITLSVTGKDSADNPDQELDSTSGAWSDALVGDATNNVIQTLTKRPTITAGSGLTFE